jgi:hypothetical protein
MTDTKRVLPYGCTPEQREVFLENLINTGNVTKSALNAGIRKSVVYAMRRDDPEFAARWEAALAPHAATPAKFDAFLDHLDSTHCVASSARAAGLTKYSVYARRETDALFAELWDDILVSVPAHVLNPSLVGHPFLVPNLNTTIGGTTRHRRR